MLTKNNYKFIRVAVLLSAALILFISRIYPLFQSGYNKYCELTKRVPVTYLTNICAVSSIIIFLFGAFISFQSRFLRGNPNARMLQIAYTRMLSDLLSVNLTMAMGYWYLYFYNKELVAGSEGSEYFEVNALLSHLDHTFPPILNLSEAYLTGGTFRVSSLLVALTAGILYYSLIIMVHHYKKVWPYKLLNNKSYPKVLIIIIIYLGVGTIMSILVMFVFQKIRNFFHSRKYKDVS